MPDYEHALLETPWWPPADPADGADLWAPAPPGPAGGWESSTTPHAATDEPQYASPAGEWFPAPAPPGAAGDGPQYASPGDGVDSWAPAEPGAAGDGLQYPWAPGEEWYPPPQDPVEAEPQPASPPGEEWPPAPLDGVADGGWSPAPPGPVADEPQYAPPAGDDWWSAAPPGPVADEPQYAPPAGDDGWSAAPPGPVADEPQYAPPAGDDGWSAAPPGPVADEPQYAPPAGDDGWSAAPPDPVADEWEYAPPPAAGRWRPHPAAPVRPRPGAPQPSGAPEDAPPTPPPLIPPVGHLAPDASAPPPPPDVPPGAEPIPAERPWTPEPSGRTLTLAPAEAPPARADDTPPGTASRSSARNAAEWVIIVGAALVAALVIKTYLVQAFYIPSPSMEPTLNIQDRVLVNKLSYRLHEVHRGDVVVFQRPPNDAGTIRDLIKRVIGLPGETVEGRDGDVYVNGRPLNEPYLPEGTVTSQFGPKTIPEGFIWVMGDNRANSSDSRVFGAVDEERVVGRAFVRVWPLDAVGFL